MTERLCDFAFNVLYVHEQLHHTYVHLYLDFNYKDSTPGKTSIALTGSPDLCLTHYLFLWSSNYKFLTVLPLASLLRASIT